MQTNNHGCWFNTVQHCWMRNDHLLNSSDHCIIFNPGDKATQRFVEEINEQVTNNILTIVMSSCENVIRVSKNYDIYILIYNDDSENGKTSFEVLPNKNISQFRVAIPGSSSSSDSSLKLRFLFAQSLDISCKTGRRIFPPFLSSVSSLKLMILSNNFPLDQWIFFFSIPYHWQYQAVRWEVKLSLKISFQVGTNWSAGHYLQC